MFRVEHANTIRLYLSRLPVSSPRALFLPPPRSSFPPVAALIGMRVALGVTGMQWWRTSGIGSLLRSPNNPSPPPISPLPISLSGGADRDARGTGTLALIEMRVALGVTGMQWWRTNGKVVCGAWIGVECDTRGNVVSVTAYNVITVPGLLPSSFTKLKTLTYLYVLSPSPLGPYLYLYVLKKPLPTSISPPITTTRHLTNPFPPLLHLPSDRPLPHSPLPPLSHPPPPQRSLQSSQRIARPIRAALAAPPICFPFLLPLPPPSSHVFPASLSPSPHSSPKQRSLLQPTQRVTRPIRPPLAAPPQPPRSVSLPSLPSLAFSLFPHFAPRLNPLTNSRGLCCTSQTSAFCESPLSCPLPSSLLVFPPPF
ncbi:unnamed protein product [Closterium sp. NIES-65]|nr:unnamed protein product [Closterium sp. NIES-65]